MCVFEILEGLPAYGQSALPFPEDGKSAFREGLVVRFSTTSTAEWIGNFQRGLAGSSCDFVLLHPDGQAVIVIAGGQGYVVDAVSRRANEFGSGIIKFAQPIDRFNAVLFSDDLSFSIIEASGWGWHSERISWDGIRNIVIAGQTVHAEAWSPISDKWSAFELDLLTGVVAGGSFSADARPSAV